MTGDWQDRAACAGKDTSVWYPESREPSKPAKAVCADCPVRAECLAWALDHDERFGIWGGLGPLQRARIRNHTGRGPTRTKRVRADHKRRDEVVRLTAAGRSIREIAETLGVSRSAVSHHRRAATEARTDSITERTA